jgi:hypothetical protein
VDGGHEVVIAADWFTSLAIDIVADALTRPHREAIDLIAARLRAVRAEGERIGAAEALEIVRNGGGGRAA